ncbi:unnamed protein product [Polarella glacialis]|uniref:Ubiquitin-like domain-containing protein n=1 Tax=Polarella glacialis TaxID=89957 RepID=A0A813GV58_POLGL|nr:unnamed protein product [Polarella glacialis]CAE8732394.1 unnamed protein product [Polarella glacialis]
MPRIEVVINKKNLILELPAETKLGDVMDVLSREEGIDVSKQVLLFGCQEFRKPPFEEGKIVMYDGEERLVFEDKLLSELNMDGSEPLVCGELQDEWLEEVKWGAFGHTVYEADYLNHREFVIFNGGKP